MKMDDDYLNKLFDKDEDETASDDGKASSSDAPDKGSDKASKKEKTEEKHSKPSKKEEPKENVEKDITEEKKPKLPKIDLDIKKLARKAGVGLAGLITKTEKKAEEYKREKELRGPSIPLSKREYLPDFPMSFKGVLTVFLCISVLFLILSVIFMPMFRVKKVVVTGNIVLSKDLLMEEANIKYDSHLWSGISGNIIDIIKMDYGKVEKRMLEQDPHIKNIRITSSIPSTIKIEVEERNKIAYIKMPDGYAAIDDEGTVIELEVMQDDGLSHAVISGLEVSGAVLSEKIEIKNENDYKKAIIVLGAILTSDINGEKSEYDMFSNVRELRMIPGGDIFLTIILPTGNEFQVKLKNIENINEKMLWLRYAISKGTFDDLPNGTFDMTGDEYIYREYR